MNLKNRIKTYAFWVALSSAVVVLVQSIGKLFGFEIESSTIENVIMSICGVLIVLGIVTNSTDSQKSSDDTFADNDSNNDQCQNDNNTPDDNNNN